MTAQHECGDIFHRDVQFLGDEIAESRRIQHAGHADDFIGFKPGSLAQNTDHGVQRIGDADDKRVRAVLLNACSDRFHDLGIDTDQVVAAHARLAGDAGGDNDHVGAFDGGVTAGTARSSAKSFNW